MAEQLNKIVITGNLAADAEVRSLPSGKSVTRFAIINNSRRRDSKGEWHDKPNHIAVVVWKLEKLAPELLKGRMVTVEGRLETRVWEGRDGNKRLSTEVIAHRIYLIPGGPRRQASDEGDQDTPPADAEAGAEVAQLDAFTQGDDGDIDPEPEDPPF